MSMNLTDVMYISAHMYAILPYKQNFCIPEYMSPWNSLESMNNQASQLSSNQRTQGSGSSIWHALLVRHILRDLLQILLQEKKKSIQIYIHTCPLGMLADQPTASKCSCAAYQPSMFKTKTNTVSTFHITKIHYNPAQKWEFPSFQYHIDKGN